MKNTAHMLAYNIEHLEQGLRMVRALDDAMFTNTHPTYYTSSIGEHLRHILEHYISFLDGLSANQIDYDNRKRDKRISSDRTFAARTIEQIIDGLSACSREDRNVEIKLDGNKDEDGPSPWSTSTLKRELQYLQAHTIHHYALMALILRLQGQEPHPDFGVAPSTLKFRKQQLQPTDLREAWSG